MRLNPNTCMPKTRALMYTALCHLYPTGSDLAHSILVFFRHLSAHSSLQASGSGTQICWSVFAYIQCPLGLCIFFHSQICQSLAAPHSSLPWGVSWHRWLFLQGDSLTLWYNMSGCITLKTSDCSVRLLWLISSVPVSSSLPSDWVQNTYAFVSQSACELVERQQRFPQVPQCLP